MASESTADFAKRMAALKNKPKPTVNKPNATTQPTVEHTADTVKLAHNVDTIETDMIFTMKDQNILADDTVEDELENIDILETDKQKYINQLRAKRTGNTTDLFNDNDTTLLSKYDEYDSYRNNTESLTLGNLINRSHTTQYNNTAETIDLTTTAKPASDIKAVKFKNKKKHHESKSERKTEAAAWWLDTDNTTDDTDRATQSLTNVRHTDNNSNINNNHIDTDQQRRDANYLKALQKAKQQAEQRILRDKQPSQSPTPDTTMTVNDTTDNTTVKHEQTGLLKPRKHDPVKALADTVRTIKTDSIDTQHTNGIKHEDTTDNDTITLTATSQFAQGLLNNDDDDELPPGINIGVKTEQQATPAAKHDTEMNGHTKHTEPTADSDSSESESDDDTSVNNTNDDSIEFMHTEVNLATGGVSAALQLAKQRALLKSNQSISGRARDNKSKDINDINNQPKLSKDVDILRLDEFGRPMSEKEAFRQLSYVFHGVGPGKKSQEKRLKQIAEQYKANKVQQTGGATSKLIEYANKSGYASAVFDQDMITKLAQQKKSNKHKANPNSDAISKKPKLNKISANVDGTTTQSYNNG